MYSLEEALMRRPHLTAPVRNHYFHGKLLDASDFQREQSYMNRKRWLLNRLLSGYGVVCGLNVRAEPEPHQIVVTPGLAIDGWGREIIVPEPSLPVQIPKDLLGTDEETQQQGGRQEPRGVHVVIFYHECPGDPMPMPAEDGNDVAPCTAATIRETYRVEIRRDSLPPVDQECRLPDIFTARQIDHAALARWISDGCPGVPDDPGIPLANVFVHPGEGHRCHGENIDISIRPIVYTNDLLYEILLALTSSRSRL